jgi:hypothetical protein
MSDYFERSGSQCEVLNANNKIETRVDRVSFNTSGNDQNRAKTPRLEASPDYQEQVDQVVAASREAKIDSEKENNDANEEACEMEDQEGLENPKAEKVV